MKKVWICLSLILGILVLIGCTDTVPDTNDEKTTYKLTVVDTYNLHTGTLNEWYEEGEEIKVYVKFLSGPVVGININNEETIAGYQYMNTSEPGEQYYTFTMPGKDIVLYLTHNGRTGISSIDCLNNLHYYNQGSLIENGTKKLFDCEYCDATKIIDVYSALGKVYSFDELLEVSSYIDISKIYSVSIDNSNGSLGRPIVHDVSISTNEKYIEAVKDFINNAEFTLATECYDGVGMYNITLLADGKSFEFGVTSANELYVNNLCYNFSMDFPTSGYSFEDWYEYIETFEDVQLSSYGNVTTLADFDLSEIHLREIQVDLFAHDFTKDADLIVDGETIKIQSAKHIYWEGRGWYTVESEKDFANLLPKGETESLIKFISDDNRELGHVFVSNNTIYTLYEIEYIIGRLTGGYPLEILNSDGSTFVDRAFTGNETIIVKLQPPC